MKLPTPETWETQVSLKGNKASTWEDLIGKTFSHFFVCDDMSDACLISVFTFPCSLTSRSQETAFHGDAAKSAQYDKGWDVGEAPPVGPEEADGRGRRHPQSPVPIQILFRLRGARAAGKGLREEP